MEKNKERVLAYKLAKEIDHKDLVEVSGGGFCHRPSGGVTGSPSSMDGNIDVVIDW